MTHKNRPSTEEKTALESQQTQKKPYKKPEFRFEKVFETVALACGKFRGGGSSCRNHRASS